MLKFYYHTAPNPMKVALCLEEMGLAYDAIPIDTRKGEQHTPEFLALNPNAKTPVIEDEGRVVFDSNAILLYLGAKTGQFMPEDTAENRAELFSWLFFIASGIGPYSGQAVHFKKMAPEAYDYAIGRYQFEAERHWGIVNDRLGRQPFMLGEAYTIVDMALWGWARAAPFVLDADKADRLTHLKAWRDGVSARPAAQRAEAIKDRHAFKSDLDEEARRAMFRFQFADQA